MTSVPPREGMMAVVRNRRAMIVGVQPFDAAEEGRLSRAIGNTRKVPGDVEGDLPSGTPLPGAEDQARLEALKAELDLSPRSLRETLETALAVDVGQPRLQGDQQGRDRLVHPVPALWQELVDHALKEGGPSGPMMALVFDPAHPVQSRSGRPVYTPESDSRLLHLGDALYHRVMSTFARCRFPGGPSAATRWTVRRGLVPAGVDALVLLSIEELAVNQLREPCHHWLRTLVFPVRGGELGEPRRLRRGSLPARAALTPHERLRLRLRAMLDAIVATLYGLDRDDFGWILEDCDHPAARLSNKAFCRSLDPKGFWRVDKAQDPELRHSVLSLAAFDDLQRSITAAAGDGDAGIQAFCDQHDGDGWMLPESLCIADLGLTRSADVGDYDDRARSPQPVRSRLGERFLPWQLEQSVEESWAECDRHARALAEMSPAPPVIETAPGRSQRQPDLFKQSRD